jgi:hypothetical protein
MVDRAYIDLHQTLADLDIRNVLLCAGIHAAGDQLIHLLATAERLDACIVYHLYDIATVGADIKLSILHI